LPKELATQAHLTAAKSTYLLNGGSCIIGPDGAFLLEPQYDLQGIIYYDLPPKTILNKEKMTLGVSGHYQRPDVFQLHVNRNRPK